MSVGVQHARQSWLRDIVLQAVHMTVPTGIIGTMLASPWMSLSFPAVLFTLSGTSVCSIAGGSLLSLCSCSDDLQARRFV